nr:helix-turn-helix transcriptional regulator [Variovorax sp. SG517]
MALNAGVPQAYLSRIERETINISIDNADVLSRVGGVPLHDLLAPAKFAGLDEQ